MGPARFLIRALELVGWGAGFGCSAVVLALIAARLPSTSGEVAAWVQAIGAVTALGGTWWTVRENGRLSREQIAATERTRAADRAHAELRDALTALTRLEVVDAILADTLFHSQHLRQFVEKPEMMALLGGGSAEYLKGAWAPYVDQLRDLQLSDIQHPQAAVNVQRARSSLQGMAEGLADVALMLKRGVSPEGAIGNVRTGADTVRVAGGDLPPVPRYRASAGSKARTLVEILTGTAREVTHRAFD